MEYGQVIAWTERDGSRKRVDPGTFPTRQEAYDAAMDAAKAWGWTQPKWWQWWRWNDVTPQDPRQELSR